MAARGFVGSGDLYIERIVAGVSQGLMGPYEASKFEIKPNIDKLDLVSKGRNTRGQVIESVSVQKPAEFTVEMSEVNKDSMTTALLGSEAARSQTSGTAAAGAFTVAALDVWLELPKGNVSAVVVTDSAGTDNYVENVDYVVNYVTGWVKPLSTGAIPVGDIKIAYSYGAITGSLISGATNADVRARLILDGVNMVDGLPCIVTVHEAIIASDAAFDFLADNFATVSLPGTMKTPTGMAEPFTVELRNAAS